MRALIFLLVLGCLLPWEAQPSGSAAHSCFCQVAGYLDDCTCDVETIDEFNNKKLFPKLQKLLETDYFRYYKVGHVCRLQCMYTEAANVGNGELECEKEKRLGAVDESLSEAAQEAFFQWNQHDDSTDDNFCEHDDEESPDAEYVDLLINPERYTGYKGPDAWKVWNSIYEENCFKPKAVKRPLNPLASGRDTWMDKIWGHNTSEFKSRFDAGHTQNEGPRRLKNLYFIYLIELRAISKVLPFFERQSYFLYTGNKTQDLKTKGLLLDILHDAKDFPLHFDENSLFAGDKKQADRLKVNTMKPHYPTKI
ncbi:hypothetical protein GDO78_010591 [Eleutherodactylus coqui]|uniref:ERO1-like protein alpha n=1 Tax=Eleutherodactylus coqui TaxID=57060 RepID=A0A8J6KAD9_ELECQ|nr:hypothetical protein GDO78_010591 [Eleutherodactylus coqui]